MDNIYTTSDYQLAVALETLGYPLIKIDRDNPRRAVFQFEHRPGIEKDVEAFFRGALPLDAKSLLLTSRIIKDRLHSGV